MTRARIERFLSAEYTMLFEPTQNDCLTAVAQAAIKQLICALWQATDYTDESLYRYARLAASYALDAYHLRQPKESV